MKRCLAKGTTLVLVAFSLLLTGLSGCGGHPDSSLQQDPAIRPSDQSIQGSVPIQQPIPAASSAALADTAKSGAAYRVDPNSDVGMIAPPHAYDLLDLLDWPQITYEGQPPLRLTQLAYRSAEGKPWQVQPAQTELAPLFHDLLRLRIQPNTQETVDGDYQHEDLYLSFENPIRLLNLPEEPEFYATGLWIQSIERLTESATLVMDGYRSDGKPVQVQPLASIGYGRVYLPGWARWFQTYQQPLTAAVRRQDQPPVIAPPAVVKKLPVKLSEQVPANTLGGQLARAGVLTLSELSIQGEWLPINQAVHDALEALVALPLEPLTSTLTVTQETLCLNSAITQSSDQIANSDWRSKRLDLYLDLQQEQLSAAQVLGLALQFGAAPFESYQVATPQAGQLVWKEGLVTAPAPAWKVPGLKQWYEKWGPILKQQPPLGKYPVE